MTYIGNFGILEFSGTEEFLKEAAQIIYHNKVEFDAYKEDSKLAGVKKLKELSGSGLRDCKEVCDLYWAGKLPNFFILDRKEKLEKLAKLPLIEELIVKIKNLKEDELRSLLMKMSVYELLSIDEFFPEEYKHD